MEYARVGWASRADIGWPIYSQCPGVFVRIFRQWIWSYNLCSSVCCVCVWARHDNEMEHCYSNDPYPIGELLKEQKQQQRRHAAKAASGTNQQAEMNDGESKRRANDKIHAARRRPTKNTLFHIGICIPCFIVFFWLNSFAFVFYVRNIKYPHIYSPGLFLMSFPKFCVSDNEEKKTEEWNASTGRNDCCSCSLCFIPQHSLAAEA